MARLSYEKLIADNTSEDLVLEHPEGDIVFRPMDSIPGDQLKLMTKLIDIVQDEKIDTDTKLDTMNQIMSMAADQKERAAELLATMPIRARVALFEAWAGNEDTGNS